jgi:membrane associated rhomboid family serine protease
MIPLRDELPTRRRPVVTYALIALNVVVFLWEYLAVAAGNTRLVIDYGLVPARFLADPLAQLPTVLSSMFMHSPDGWWHIGGNMLFLWVFGDNVEDALGRSRFVAFYLASGVAAAAAQIAVGPGSPVPMVGASGAVAGVLAAYGSLYPRAPVLVLNPVLPLWLFWGPVLRIPAFWIILEFFAFNLLHGVGSIGRSGGGVAFFAHLGGFVAGLLLVRVLLRAEPPDADPWQGWRPPPRLPRDPWRHPSPRPPGRRRRGGLR